MWGYLAKQRQCLEIRDRVAERRRMPFRRGLLPGDLSRADVVGHKSQQLNFGIRDADNNAPILVRMQPCERHGAFAIDQAGDVRSDFGCKLFGESSLIHDVS